VKIVSEEKLIGFLLKDVTHADKFWMRSESFQIGGYGISDEGYPADNAAYEFTLICHREEVIGLLRNLSCLHRDRSSHSGSGGRGCQLREKLVLLKGCVFRDPTVFFRGIFPKVVVAIEHGAGSCQTRKRMSKLQSGNWE
jgi:hypothetical protein